MALRITIDLFSGRPNPSVVVSGLEEREALERVAASAPRARAAASVAAGPPFLGYRGIVVEPVEPAPAARRGARRSRATPPTARRAGEAPALEDWLASASGPFRAAGLGPRFLDHVQAEIERSRARAAFPARRARAVAAAAEATPRGACRCAPIWEPGWWNDGGPIQAGNNCYNYAVNYRSDTYAQPGRANGAMFATVDPGAVKGAALADALVDAPTSGNRCPRQGHLVALVVSPWDFHWYRKQRSGRWTHKPGGGEATQLDESGNPIDDPRTADRGPYTDFAGFLVVLPGHVKIG